MVVEGLYLSLSSTGSYLIGILGLEINTLTPPLRKGCLRILRILNKRQPYPWLGPSPSTAAWFIWRHLGETPRIFRILTHSLLRSTIYVRYSSLTPNMAGGILVKYHLGRHISRWKAWSEALIELRALHLFAGVFQEILARRLVCAERDADLIC